MVIREYADEKTYKQSLGRAQRPLTLYFLLWPIFVKRHHMKFQPLIHGLASTQVPWCTKNCIKRASSSLMSSYKSKRSFDKLGVLVFIVVSNYILSVKRCVPSKYMNIFIFFRVIYTRIAQISTSSPSQPLKNSNKYP